MTIREIHAAKHASKTGIEYFEARVEAQFDRFRRDMTLRFAVMISV